MHRGRVSRTFGAAVCGLLGVALLPAAVALADDWTITPDPNSTELITGLYGHGFDGGDTAPPAVAGSIQGHQNFDYTDNTTGAAGTFHGFESYSIDGFGDTNEEVYVAANPSGADAPSVGSVFDTYTFGGGFYQNIYSAIHSSSGDTITDTYVTPLGTYTLPVTFDAANGAIADEGGVNIGNGVFIDPVGSQTTYSISGIPPLTVALQGTQNFSVANAMGHPIGSVATVDTTTTDGVGTYTEAALVTKDLSGIAGTGSGEVPAVGSIFNTMVLGSYESIYSDLVSPNGGANLITDTVLTPYGDYTIPVTLDASRVETTAALELPDGAQLNPAGALDITAVNGLPPVDVGVQGQQMFTYVDTGGVGTFDADVTNTLDEFGDTTETLLVTKDIQGDAPPVGSEYEVVNWGYGYESIYSAIASTTSGGDMISETLVTPYGDFILPPSFDAAAGLAADHFLNLLGV